MIAEHYAQLKSLHVLGVVTSIALFSLRGGLVLGGYQTLAGAAPLRYASYAIDTLLLSAALLMLSVLPSAAYANHWLSLKVGLLLVYVGLGSFALKRGRSWTQRAICFALALLTVAAMYGIARAHHPLGWWRIAVGG